MTRGSANDDSSDVEPEYRWVVRVWLLVAAFAVVTVVYSLHIDIPIRKYFSYLVSRPLNAAVFLVVLALIDAAVRAPRPGWTVPGAIRVLGARWTRRRIALTTAALLAYHLVYLCYRNLKSWDVVNQPRDDMLLRWDRWFFFGHDPAVLLHNLLGRDLATHVLTALYESFSYVVVAAVVCSLVFPRRMRDSYVFIASAMWIWILGVGCYYLIPSLGPFNSEPEVFAGLPHTVIQDDQERYMAQRAHLLAHPSAPDAFAQVSAFASLHVGVTCLIMLMARYYGLRLLTRVLFVYLVGTIIATVYLGWHFAVDDVAGIAIAYVAMYLGRWMIYPQRLVSLLRRSATTRR